VAKFKLYEAKLMAVRRRYFVPHCAADRTTYSQPRLGAGHAPIHDADRQRACHSAQKRTGKSNGEPAALADA
jgi:hypothetical protein